MSKKKKADKFVPVFRRTEDGALVILTIKDLIFDTPEEAKLLTNITDMTFLTIAILGLEKTEKVYQMDSGADGKPGIFGVFGLYNESARMLVLTGEAVDAAYEDAVESGEFSDRTFVKFTEDLLWKGE